MSPEPTVDLRAWRPQAFGNKRAQQIRDPIIEPLWDGDRVLVHVGPGGVEIVDIEGVAGDAVPEVAAAVASAVRAERLVLDGYLTPQASRSGEGAILGEVSVPTATQMTAQIFLGRVRERKRELQDAPPPEVRPGYVLVFVAIDLIALDGEPLAAILAEAREPQLLVLDEPTNHLDLESINALNIALQKYQGTVLLVTHDHDVIDEVATRIWHFHGGRVDDFKGPYADFLAEQQAKVEQAARQDRKPARQSALSR